jgi:2-alkenal reductase
VTPRGELWSQEKSTIELFERASPSVVRVFGQTTTQEVSRSRSTSGSGSSEVSMQSGSGIVWDAFGHVVTSYHVVAGTDRIGVRLASGEFLLGRVIGSAPAYDLAVVQLEKVRGVLTPISVGTSAQLHVGQLAFAIGNPYGLDQTLTSGIVSALHRRIPVANLAETTGFIQTDAAVNPGNSGGPLLDSAGRLIGVNTAIMSGSGSSAGIGFAIPVDTVNRIVPQLIRTGHVALPGIGVVVFGDEPGGDPGIDGVVVLRTVPGSPAEKAGLRGVEATGEEGADVITEANGRSIHNASDLASILDNVGIGRYVDLTILRSGRSRSLRVGIADMSRHQP